MFARCIYVLKKGVTVKIFNMFQMPKLQSLKKGARKVQQNVCKADEFVKSVPLKSEAGKFRAFLENAKYQDKPVLTKSDMERLVLDGSFMYGTCNTPIKNFEAKIMAVLSNPEELKYISEARDRAFAVYRAIQDPLESTLKANPNLYPAEFFTDVFSKK